MINIAFMQNAIELLRSTLAERDAQLAEREALIIEADAAYNTDHREQDFETASLGLVRMCYEGAGALTKLAAVESVDDLEQQLASRDAQLAAAQFEIEELRIDREQAHRLYEEAAEQLAACEAERDRLRNFAAGRGMVSEADDMAEVAVLVCGLHDQLDACREREKALTRALEKIRKET